MEKLRYHFHRGCMIVVLLTGMSAIVGVAMLAGWGLAEITRSFF